MLRRHHKLRVKFTNPVSEHLYTCHKYVIEGVVYRAEPGFDISLPAKKVRVARDFRHGAIKRGGEDFICSGGRENFVCRFQVYVQTVVVKVPMICAATIDFVPKQGFSLFVSLRKTGSSRLWWFSCGGRLCGQMLTNDSSIPGFRGGVEEVFIDVTIPCP